MKIAFPTDDGKFISAHFGRAPYFVVADIQDGDPVDLQTRSKAYHGSQEEQHHHQNAEGHGGMHQDMFGVIADCSVLIAGGMGEPAYQHAQAAGLQVILTGEKEIQSALKQYQEGHLESDMRRIHIHR